MPPAPNAPPSQDHVDFELASLSKSACHQSIYAFQTPTPANKDKRKELLRRINPDMEDEPGDASDSESDDKPKKRRGKKSDQPPEEEVWHLDVANLGTALHKFVSSKIAKIYVLIDFLSIT